MIKTIKELMEIYEVKTEEDLDWSCISEYQQLSEPFIERHKDEVDWYRISAYQQLSEGFIERHKDEVNWYRISEDQHLSEGFIERHKDKVNWVYISADQQLSEGFIERHKDKVNWYRISRYQQLSEPFIERHKDEVDWSYISADQKLSEDFIERHDIEVSEGNWLYWDKSDKIKYIKEQTEYDFKDNYIHAYKSVNFDGTSVYKPNFYKYEVGESYTSHCDCNAGECNSFGLSAWTEQGALEYYNKGLLLKVKIHLDDLGCITQKGKIRAFKLTVCE